MATELLGRYLDVEEVFQSDGAATEQEIIDALRKARLTTLIYTRWGHDCPADSCLHLPNLAPWKARPVFSRAKPLCADLVMALNATHPLF